MAGRTLRLTLAVPLLLLAACEKETPPSRTADDAGPAGRAAAVVAAMSDQDLAGQVLMPYAYGSAATSVDRASAAANRALAGVDTPAEMVAKFHLGGLILVGFAAEDPTGATNPTTNVENPRQVREFTDGLQAAARQLPGGVPLMIGTDQEYGVVTRVTEGVTMLPSAMASGAAHRPELTEAAWRAAGRELAAMGITVDFAPVADTLGPAGNTVIGSRAFGADPKANSVLTAAAVRGLESAGVTAGLKHFPGHGHTAGDSHQELPVVAQDRAAWEQADRPPFQAGVDAGAGGSVIHLVGYGDTAADLDQDAVVTVMMDTPYLLASSRSEVLLAAYSSSKLSLTAVAAVVAGRAKAPGRSPVAVPGLPRSAC